MREFAFFNPSSLHETQWASLTSFILPDRCILGKQGYTLSIQVDSRDEHYADMTQEFKLHEQTANVHEGANDNVFYIHLSSLWGASV